MKVTAAVPLRAPEWTAPDPPGVPPMMPS